MNAKSSGLLVSDLFEELREKNNTLLSQLLFAKQLNHILENYRNLLKVFCNNCKCDENIIIKNNLNNLENDYKNVFNSNEKEFNINNDLIEQKSKTLNTIEVNNSLNTSNDKTVRQKHYSNSGNI